MQKAFLFAFGSVALLALVLLVGRTAQPDEGLEEADFSAVQVSRHQATQQDEEAQNLISFVDQADKRSEKRAQAKILAKEEKAANEEVDRDLKKMEEQQREARENKKKVAAAMSNNSKKNSNTKKEITHQHQQQHEIVAARPQQQRQVNNNNINNNDKSQQSVQLAVAERRVKRAEEKVKVAAKAAAIVQDRVAKEARTALQDHSVAKEKEEQAVLYRSTAAVLKKKSLALKAKAGQLAAKLQGLKKKEMTRKRLAEKSFVGMNGEKEREKQALRAVKAAEAKLAALEKKKEKQVKKVKSLDHAVADLNKMAASRKADAHYARHRLEEAADAIDAQQERVRVKEREAYNRDVQSDPLYRDV